MKSAFTGVLVLLLAGGAVFGVVKSLDLLNKNADLGYSLSLLDTRIEEMRSTVADVQERLRESGVLNEQLTNEVAGLKTTLAEKEKKIGQYHQYAVLLKKKMSDVAAVNDTLSQDMREMRDLLTRVHLENEEMRQKLSSVKELRLAIRELQRRPEPRRAQPRRVPARRAAAPRTAPQRREAEAVMGNEGFLLRDGASTFFGKVNIQVRPAPEAADPTP
ncbi:MAG: hypothetical protein ACM3L6_00260 [Deltaproteobacteria bacterium]